MAKGRPSKGGRSRGEVNDITAQLEQLSALDGRKPDVVQLKRECFQKLIRYMTAGIDMSAAFVPATKCVALSKFDLPLKKMLYLYLRSAARQNEAVALLVVQAMLNDCRDADPTIRGLAVRSMCSLRVPDLLENVFQAVTAGLGDAHPYVREVSVMGVLRCHHQDAAGTQSLGLVDRVRALLPADPDPQVVANCLYVLQQLGALEGAMTRTLVVSLLNHIRAFSDWAQCLVLEVLLKWYRPSSEAERFDVLDVLDFGLAHTNSAVVLATAKLFLHFTANYPDQYGRVLEAVKGPLQALLLGREPEIVYAALSNLLALAQRHPTAFSDLGPDLFCRPEDPSYLKSLKLEALVASSTASTAYDAAEEASQYARDADPEVSRAAVHAVAHIALKVPEVDGVLDRLLHFLGHARTEVAAEAVAAMADVLRRFPDAAEASVPAVAEVDARALEPSAARAAYVWVLGEYGEKLQDAPYILEAMAGKFGEEVAEVKLALLSAVAKLFFKRPPECRPALGAALSAGCADSDPGVHERARLYYRLLQKAGPEAAQAIIAAPRPAAAQFEEAQSAEVQDRLFDEWNTLSVVYRVPAATFIDPGSPLEHADVQPIGRTTTVDGMGAGAAEDAAAADGGTALLLELDADSDSGAPSSAAASAGDLFSLDTLNGSAGPVSSVPPGSLPAPSVRQQTQQSAIDMLGDLLGGDGSAGGLGAVATAMPPAAAAAPAAQLQSLGSGLDDLLSGFGGPPSAPADAHFAAQQQPAESVELAPQPRISAQQFQANWAAWSPSGGFTQDLGPSAVAAVQSHGHREFLDHVKQANVASFATPKEIGTPPYRFLFHAQRAQRGGAPGSRVLAQVTVALAPAPSAAVVVKSDDAAAAGYVEEVLQNLLLSL